MSANFCVTRAFLVISGVVLLFTGNLSAQTQNRREHHVDNRYSAASSLPNATCSSGVCGGIEGTSEVGVEYALSVEHAKLLSAARSVEDVLQIFGMNSLDIDEPPLAASSARGYTPTRTFQLMGQKGSPGFAGPPGPPGFRGQNNGAHGLDGYGRKADIDFAANAGCSPEKVTVPIKVSEAALESRHYHIVPTCTRIERCGGCCNHDLLSCQPVATEIVTMNILAIPMVASLDPRPMKIPVQVEKHTNCSCDCITKPSDCSPFQEHRDCRCVCKNVQEEQLCAADPRRIWDPKSCHCACKYSRPCATGLFFDPISCRCEPLTYDDNGNLIYQSFRNRRPMLPLPSSTTESYSAGGVVSDFGVTSSPSVSTTPRRRTAGRFWQRSSDAAIEEDSEAPQEAASTQTSTTTTSTTEATTTRTSAPTPASLPRLRSNMDDLERFGRPSVHRRTSATYQPTRRPPNIDDNVEDSTRSFSRHRQQNHLNVPALKAWKVSTATGASSGPGGASMTSLSNGNSLDPTTHDEEDDDVVTRGNALLEDEYGGSDRGDDSQRRGRFHDPNEKDRIRNNISAFKKGIKRP